MKVLMQRISAVNLALLMSVSYAADDNTQMYYFKQQIDHNNNERGFFSQRYYINDSYSDSSKAPVFFYICGESECTADNLTGYVRTLAQKYHGRLVALEHRYYGQSLPTKTFSAIDLKYLSSKQALQDLAAFEQYMISKEHWEGKWVAMGGSYSGMLAAYYRSHYPNLVVGALASSAPVMAKAYFTGYDERTAKTVGPECSSNVLVATKEVENAMNDNNRMAEIKKMFGAEEIVDNTDFLDYLSTMAALPVQYGAKDLFCSAIAESPTPIEGMASIAQMITQMTGIKPVIFTAQGAMSENPNDYPLNIGARQFYYQACTEFGFWPVASSDRQKSMKSSLLNYAYYQNICKRLFNLDKPADTDATNKENYLPLLDSAKTSHIFFSNGSDDPWSELSIMPDNGNTTNPNLNYFVIANAGHTVDLKEPDNDSDSDSLKQARQQFETLLDGWLS